MKIAIIGNESSAREIEESLGENHSYNCYDSHETAAGQLSDYELLVDFIVDENVEGFEVYNENSQMRIFCNCAKVSLAELILMGAPKTHLVGFNGLPTMVNRDLFELSLPADAKPEELEGFCAKLQLNYTIVADRVGLVTPRVVCMIINEAYYTVQEGTAKKEDIDSAMKLGTNYPFGPFEWCARIGIDHVYEVLSAVYEDTGDPRYKICPMLKQEYLSFLGNTIQQ